MGWLGLEGFTFPCPSIVFFTRYTISSSFRPYHHDLLLAFILYPYTYIPTLRPLCVTESVFTLQMCKPLRYGLARPIMRRVLIDRARDITRS